MAARRKSRSRSRSTGKLALKLALIAGAAGVATSLIVGMILVSKLAGQVTGTNADAVVSQSYMVAVVLALVAGFAVAGTAFGLGSGLAARLTDLGLAVSKMGRGAKTTVRVTGTDEITTLGRALSSLASEVTALTGSEEDGGAAVTFDPQVRALRDKALPQAGFEFPEGFELDAAMSPGSRGGSDYFDSRTVDGRAVMFLISFAGSNAVTVVAARMARDEMLAALDSGSTAREALVQTNGALHRNLPRGVCATATVIEVAEDSAEIYQAGSRVPVILCAAGELEDLTAEGLALGLDSGPVFEKGLRANTVDMRPGMRLVVLNDAGNRNDELVDSIRQHSPKHTAPFMNMVLGELEEDAGAGGLREDVVLMTVKRS